MAMHKLALVRRARKALLEARDLYVETVIEAYDKGASPTDIAAAACVTEGAIRQTIKRGRPRAES